MPNNKIINGSKIYSVSQITFKGLGIPYFRVLINESFTGIGVREYRIHRHELMEVLKTLNYIVEEPKGNRKYPYLKPNVI